MLVHISDLHIGHPSISRRQPPRVPPDPATGMDPRRPTWWPTARGHDFNVSQDFANWWKRAYLVDSSSRIVVTGDVTRTGKGSDFGSAHTFLRGHWRNGARGHIRVGLDADAATLWNSPGNHDYWGGTVFGLPNMAKVASRIAGSHFWQQPWVEAYEDPGAPETVVQVVSIDSLSGLAPLSPHQLLAYGGVATEHLRAASELMTAQLEDLVGHATALVRVAILHHPPTSISALAGRREIEQWLHDEGIHVVLCGHTHFRDVPLPGSCPPLVLTAGTTLQRGTARLLPGKQPHHFFAHHLKRSSPRSLRVSWRIDDYWHNGARWVDPPTAGVPEFEFEAAPL